SSRRADSTTSCCHGARAVRESRARLQTQTTGRRAAPKQSIFPLITASPLPKLFLLLGFGHYGIQLKGLCCPRAIPSARFQGSGKIMRAIPCALQRMEVSDEP